jgi:hypothetical protein
MVVAVAVGVGCVLVLVALAGVLRYVRRPVLEPLDPASVALPREPAPQQIKILRSAEELDAAIERASTTEAVLAEMASKRADRYNRFSGPRSVTRRLDSDGTPRVTRLRIGDEPTPPAGTAEPGM